MSYFFSPTQGSKQPSDEFKGVSQPPPGVNVQQYNADMAAMAARLGPSATGAPPVRLYSDQTSQNVMLPARRAPPSLMLVRGKTQGKKVNKKGIPRPLKGIQPGSSLKDLGDYKSARWTTGSRGRSMVRTNVEEKESYQSIQSGVVTGQMVQQLVFIAQGSDYFQRTGDSIKVTNMRLSFTVYANGTASSNVIRFIVLRDFMNTGSLPAVGAVLQDVSTNNLAICSPLLHDVGDRFEVLCDEILTVDTDGSSILHRTLGFNVSDHVLFQGSTSAYADTWQGHPILVTITDQATNGPSVFMSCLTQYVDN